MSQSLVKNLVHLVYGTKHRESLIPKKHWSALFAYQSGIFKQWESPALVIGGVEDHVHVLFALSKNHPLKKIVEEVKKGSSVWIKEQSPSYADFHWQTGYAIFSVSQSLRNNVATYVRNQETHHAKKTFEDEYLEFLEKHGIAYDPRFVFDTEFTS